MSHEPKLNIYTIKIKPGNKDVDNSNRALYKHLTDQVEKKVADSVLFMDVFSEFIKALDTQEMFADEKSRKCMTANQADIGDDSVNTNIIPHSRQFIIEGKVEGGTYGRKRNKTSTLDKRKKTGVDEKDAITEDFYFLLYMPPESNTIILMLQAYSDDAIDSVMRKFCEKFFSVKAAFQKPFIQRFVPKSIIDDFKKNSTVSSLSFSTEMPSDTLLGKSVITQKNFRVKVVIETIKEPLTIREFQNSIDEIQKVSLVKRALSTFANKKGSLKDNSTAKQTTFELGTNFEIQPYIILSKYVTIRGDESDFKRIQNYCFTLLDEVRQQVYPGYATKER
jgi:hypothetical protein